MGIVVQGERDDREMGKEGRWVVKGGGSLPDCASFLILRTSNSASLSMSSAISLINLQSYSSIKYGQGSNNQGDQDNKAGKLFMF